MSLISHLRGRRPNLTLPLAIFLTFVFFYVASSYISFFPSQDSSRRDVFDLERHKLESRQRLDNQIRQRKWEPYTRVVAGVRGFWVFENVYVKNRIMCEFDVEIVYVHHWRIEVKHRTPANMHENGHVATVYSPADMVPHPNAPPFPPMREIISQQIHDSYTFNPTDPSLTPEISFPSEIAYRLAPAGASHHREYASQYDSWHPRVQTPLLSREAEAASGFDRNNVSSPDDLLSQFALRCENDDHPHIPRLHLLIPPLSPDNPEPPSRETYASRIAAATANGGDGRDVAGLELGLDVRSAIPGFGRDEMYRIGKEGDVRYEKENAGNGIRRERGIGFGIWDRVSEAHRPGELEARISTSWLESVSGFLGFNHARIALRAQLDLEETIQVLDGLTFYLADDPVITGWGSLMHHYFHFAGEVLVGTFKAAAVSVLKPFEAVEEVRDDQAGSDWDSFGMRRRSDRDRTIQRTSGGDLEDHGLASSPSAANSTRLNPRREPLDNSHFQPEAVLESLMPFPERIIFPWNRNWEDRELQATILNEGFGHPEIYGRERWREMAMDGRWRMFERVVITDRHAAHTGGMTSETERWNKMALDMIEVPLPEQYPNYLTAAQLSLFDGLGSIPIPIARPAKGNAIREGVVKLVYVDRQGSDRKFSNQSNDDLNEILDQLQRDPILFGDAHAATVRVEVIRAQFEKMDTKAQLETVSDADIILGIHGNGLTHLIWARSGATIIEFFPNGSFIRDYETLSTAAGHQHLPIWHDRILPKSEWHTFPRETEPGKLHDGSLTTFDRKFIDQLLHDTVTHMARR